MADPFPDDTRTVAAAASGGDAPTVRLVGALGGPVDPSARVPS